MADNTILNIGSGGDTISTDDIAGVKVQRVKIQHGTDGSATDVSTSSPLPINDAGGTLSVDDGAGSLTVDGTVGVSGTVTVDSELTTADLDTGAGTDTRAVVGIAGAASGGAVLVQSTAGGLMKVDASGAAVPVTDNSGSLTVDAANTSAAVAAYSATDAVISAGVALVPKRAFANVTASQTDSSIVAAVASKKLRVLAMAAVAGATATNLTFNTKPAGAGSAISPLFANAANGGEILPFNPVGWFETSSGEGLTVTTGAGSTTGILVTYVEV